MIGAGKPSESDRALADDINRQMTWRWSDMRQIGVEVGFWPLDWFRLDTYRSEDRWGGTRSLTIGPIELSLHYNNGGAFDDESQ